MTVEIVNGMVAVVRAGLPQVKTVDRYAGQLEQEIEQMAFLDPAVFVAYTGSVPQRVDNRMFFEDATFTTLIACRDLRGRDAVLGAADVLTRAVVDLLANGTLGLNIEPLTPTRVDLVFISEALCIYGISWTTSFHYVPTVPA